MALDVTRLDSKDGEPSRVAPPLALAENDSQQSIETNVAAIYAQAVSEQETSANRPDPSDPFSASSEFFLATWIRELRRHGPELHQAKPNSDTVVPAAVLQRAVPYVVESPSLPLDAKEHVVKNMPEAFYRTVRAIAKVESGRKDVAADYGAIGQRTKTGYHAIGAYQVMEQYVGAWTEKALGRKLTAEEFRRDRAAQDGVAEFMMARYWRERPDPRNVASRWFTGRPFDKNFERKVAHRSDGISTAREYVGKTAYFAEHPEVFASLPVAHSRNYTSLAVPSQRQPVRHAVVHARRLVAHTYAT